MQMDKGNSDKHKGSVIVYSSWFNRGNYNIPPDLSNFVRLDKGEVVYAVYATHDPEEFIDKTGTPKEKIEKSIDEYKRRATEMFLNHPEKAGIQVFSCSMVFPRLEEIINGDINEDVVFAGTSSDPEECKRIVRSAITKYFRKFIQQEEKLKSINEFQGTARELEMYLGREFFYKLTNSYSPYLLGKADKSKYEEEKEKFLSFIGNSSLKSDAQLLCNLIESVKNPIELNDRLAIPIIKRMSHLFFQDYDSAAEITPNVKALKKKYVEDKIGGLD